MNHEYEREQGSDGGSGEGDAARRGHDDNSSSAAADEEPNRRNEIDSGDSSRVGEGREVDSVGDRRKRPEVVESDEAEAEVVEAVTRGVVRELRTVRRSWRGPLPPASELEAYENVLSGSAERILRMAEKALDSQIDVDTTLAHGDVASVRRGQWQSTAIVSLSVGAALTGGLLHLPWELSAAFLAPGIFEFGSNLVRAIREPRRQKDGKGDEG